MHSAAATFSSKGIFRSEGSNGMQTSRPVATLKKQRTTRNEGIKEVTLECLLHIFLRVF
jgi:hypothetical protein